MSLGEDIKRLRAACARMFGPRCRRISVRLDAFVERPNREYLVVEGLGELDADRRTTLMWVGDSAEDCVRQALEAIEGPQRAQLVVVKRAMGDA